MLSVPEALDRLNTALAAARQAGADAADAVYVGDLSTGVQVRLGALEDVGSSEGEEIGVRLFFGTRSASVSTSDLGPDALIARSGEHTSELQSLMSISSAVFCLTKQHKLVD